MPAAIRSADRNCCPGPPGRSACNTNGRLEITSPWGTVASRCRGQSCGSDFSEMLWASEETKVALRRSCWWRLQWVVGWLARGARALGWPGGQLGCPKPGDGAAAGCTDRNCLCHLASSLCPRGEGSGSTDHGPLASPAPAGWCRVSSAPSKFLTASRLPKTAPGRARCAQKNNDVHTVMASVTLHGDSTVPKR